MTTERKRVGKAKTKGVGIRMKLFRLGLGREPIKVLKVSVHNLQKLVGFYILTLPISCIRILAFQRFLESGCYPN